MGRGRKEAGRRGDLLKSAPEIDVFGDVSDACAALARRDKGLGRALAAIGAPHVRRRPGGFEALFRIIVEQQVSVPSAQAIWARCRAGLDVSDAQVAAALDIQDFRALGLSGPKARYVSALARRVAEGELDLDAVARSGDEDAARLLLAVTGVGPWTAAIYLLFCEGRIDVWPPGDVALMTAYQAAANLAERPSARALDARAQDWAPYRGLAAHVLWTYYAHLRGREPI